MTAASLLVAEGITPGDVALVSRALTAAGGLFVASLAYRGYRRNDAPRMGFLALGIGLLTIGTFLVAVVADLADGSAGVVLVVRGSVTVAGLSAILYALTYGDASASGRR